MTMRGNDLRGDDDASTTVTAVRRTSLLNGHRGRLATRRHNDRELHGDGSETNSLLDGRRGRIKARRRDDKSR